MRFPTHTRRGLGDINALAAGIQQMEGYYPGSLAYVNNNPGNLMYVGQAGATKSCSVNGFCYAAFPTYDAGYQALLNQINVNASSGMTLSQFVCHYAGCSLDCSTCPAGANNTTVYLAQLQSATGATADTPLTSIISGYNPTPVPSDLAGSSDDTTDTSTGLDFTDPTTILITAAVGLAAWYFLA